jgi:Na+/pantothenate symporter
MIIFLGINYCVQSPSKLIDYALVGKPILSVKSKELDSILIDEFLSRNYENRFIVQGIEKYDIRNVCWKFLKLAQ